MNGESHRALCDVLDDEDGAQGDGVLSDHPELAKLLQEEHQARVKAESQSQDQAQRLAVHSEQVAEYASQKLTDMAELKARAESLRAQLTSSKGSADFEQQLTRLCDLISEAAYDAQSFAEQAQQDSQRHQTDNSHIGPTGDVRAATDTASAEAMDADEADLPRPAALEDTGAYTAPQPSTSFAERAKYIPMRLALEDRRFFRLLEAALNVSEYTDKVDVLTFRRKDGRITAQIKDICSILSGLVVASDYRRGQELIKNRDFKQNSEFFQVVFEIGRRYKIMNPDRMRSEYGKLLYMLMDAARPEIEELLEFSVIRPLNTVHSFLEERGASALLSDPLMEVATAEIHSAFRQRHAIQQDIKTKENARRTLAHRYANPKCDTEDILNAIYSFSDNNSYLLFNRDPVDKVIGYLKQYFKPQQWEDGLSLAITPGKDGARLAHSHERQYAYVLQSLSLWSEIATDMFRLWYLAEQDLLQPGNNYRLCDTGQGLNRVQHAPRVSRAMHDILARTQRRVGAWVGSAVVHLGDHNVPNALMFIDKYTQVPRILNPVVQVLEELPALARDPEVNQYIHRVFGSVDACRKAILCDFFRHGFDGSGADNFFDAGSCIDGRLTSAWNWCSKLEKKPFYIVFKMAGFVGFDGDFK